MIIGYINKLDKIKNKILLNKKNLIYQPDKTNYSKNSKIYNCVVIFKKIVKKITKKTSRILLFSLCIELRRISNKLFYEGKEFSPDYKKIKTFMK